MMANDDIVAELFARGRGITPGTIFVGGILGREHEFAFEAHRCKVRLPAAEFEAGSADPVGAGARTVRFRRGWTDDPSPMRSFYEVDHLDVEIDFLEPVRIPSVLLDVDAVQKSPDLVDRAPHLDKLAVRYDDLLVRAWRHWMRVARWATSQYLLGIRDWSSSSSDEIEMPRLQERSTGFSVWASTHRLTLSRSASIDEVQWKHIGEVLVKGDTPPVWFEQLTDAHRRFAEGDLSGCVLSGVIACETLARAVYMDLVGNPANPAASELANRVAAQAIIGKWKELTGLKAEGRLHALFEMRNALVHSGRTDAVEKSRALNALQTASRFVEAGDDWWFVRRGCTNPRITKATVQL